MKRKLVYLSLFLIISLISGCEGFFIDDLPIERTNPKDPDNPDAVTVFEEDFEGLWYSTWEFWWMEGSPYPDPGLSPYWGDSTARASGGDYSAYCVAQNNPNLQVYQNNLQTWMNKENIDLRGYSTAILHFDMWYELEEDWDFFTVFILDDNLNWHNMKHPSQQDVLPEHDFPFGWTGNTNGWSYNVTVDLSNYCGQSNISVVFLFKCDDSNPSEGVYVDNVILKAL